MATHNRYIAIFSSENMVYGYWIALFTVWWTPGSLLDTPIGPDGHKVSTCVLTRSLSPCWVPLLVPFSTFHWVLLYSQFTADSWCRYYNPAMTQPSWGCSTKLSLSRYNRSLKRYKSFHCSCIIGKLQFTFNWLHSGISWLMIKLLL